MTTVPHIRLSELNALIRKVLDTAFKGEFFWVVADVTSHTYRQQKNYHSFELVEKEAGSDSITAKIAAKAWGTAATKILTFERLTGQLFTSGIRVLVNVSVQFHPVFGLQLNLNDIDTHFTLGVLEQQRQATLSRLVSQNDFITKEGDEYITANKTLLLPPVIQRIALVSSSTSAGGEDFIHSLRNNSFNYFFQIDEYHTVVQGEANADAFLSTLISVFTSGNNYDAVVITRGGGAQTDFLIFDNYQIGRAIAKFPIPVITGIGHQKNETIADLMAHTNTKTPTKAAEFIVGHNRRFEERLLVQQQMLVIRSQQLLTGCFRVLATHERGVASASRQLLDDYKHSLNKQTSDLLFIPRITLKMKQSALGYTLTAIKNRQLQYLKNQQAQLAHFDSVVRIMAPENLLKKGFALVKVNGKITADANVIHIGDDIEVVLRDATITSTVKNKTKYDGDEINL